jgi:hypothetical protein
MTAWTEQEDNRERFDRNRGASAGAARRKVNKNYPFDAERPGSGHARELVQALIEAVTAAIGQ